MPTQIYETGNINLIDGTEVFISPLKIKYLREFMEVFDKLQAASGDQEAISLLSECARIAMKQYYPSISKTVDDLEDNLDLPTIYKVLDISAGIKVNPEKKEPVKKQAQESESSWDKLDLAELESEVFLLGIWKDYDELESSLSMPELSLTLTAKREQEYNEKKFHAAIQGIDLDKQSGKKNEWEEMKARVFSSGGTSDPNDVLAFQGVNAQKAGFGIGMGLSYENIGKK
jgi:hypothetical protein